MKYWILCLIGLTLFGCSHKASTPQVGDSPELIFFDGTYKQKIEVNYVKDQKTERATFNAILKKSPQEIYMYCYVGFGYTLFKLKDNFLNPIEFTTSEERIEKNKDFFLKIYPLIKETLRLKKSDPRLNNGEMTLMIAPENFPVRVVISGQKIQGIPREVIFENKDHFKFLITNLEFAP